MIITLEMPPESLELIARHARKPDELQDVMADAVGEAVVAGAEGMREGLQRDGYGLTMRHPASGLAASLSGWMLDRQTGAIGVPANTPAAKYAQILNDGGTIYPRNAKALAVPISEEARRHSSPRDMPDLTYIARKSGPPLLVRQLTRRGNVRGFELHWVLLASVTIPAFHWFEKAVEDNTDAITEAFGGVATDWIGTFDN